MRNLLILLVLSILMMSACSSGEDKPATPLETFKTYTKAIKKKDITTMKLLLSRETLKLHAEEAKSQGVTVDDIVKRETLFSEHQTSVEFRNEKIDGEKATLGVRPTLRFKAISLPWAMEAALTPAAWHAAGWVLPVTNTFDIAPTIAMLLRLELPDAEGQPIVGILTAK